MHTTNTPMAKAVTKRRTLLVAVACLLFLCYLLSNLFLLHYIQH